MRQFYFREMLLSSVAERKARRVAFHPEVTLIRGENETGKSSLLKSLFLAFGAEPAKVHPTWKAASVRILVRFELDGQSYAILRHADRFAVFDGRGALLERFVSVTSDLAPFFARLLKFGLRLPSRAGEFVPLPPAYYFLPYYMDQDGSWTAQWTGFAKLEQFPNWKKGVIEYHAGIRGNEYYEAQGVKLDAEAEAARTLRKREGLQEVYRSLSERFEAVQFDVDFGAYRDEVDELLLQCDKLRSREERFKRKIAELRNQRQALQTQLDITLHARDESAKDYAFASGQSEAVQCPTCGAGYDNSFAERFAIAMDEDHCAELIERLQEELRQSDQAIQREMDQTKTVTDEIGAIERLMARREGELALGDLIRQEGRRELRGVMQRDISALETREGELRVRATECEGRMRRFDGKDRRKEVNAQFSGTMSGFLGNLDVVGLPESSYQRVDAIIQDTGSELPRALLAYKIAFLRTVQQFGSTAVAPLVIDSPNQQDQDRKHLRKILSFLREFRPKGVQLVLGLVDSAGVDFGGEEIVLDRKHSLLASDDFARINEEMQGYVDQSVG